MLRQLGALAVVCVVLVGPAVALLVLLNFRERRQRRLLGTVARELVRLRGCVAFRVCCAAFWPASVVRLDMWLCTPREMWDTSLRVLERLPPGVRLVVEGPLNGELVGTIAVVARRRTAPGRPWSADSHDAHVAARAGDAMTSWTSPPEHGGSHHE